MKIVDLGNTFGMGVAAEIFGNDHTIVTPPTLHAAEKALEGADLLCFGGGEDVWPGLYGHSNVASHTSGISKRDIFESIVFDFAKVRKVPMLGVCRGAQFICARSGGSLIQDLSKHPFGGHLIQLNETQEDGRTEIFISSTHHQAMVPWKIPHKLIGYFPNEKTINHTYDHVSEGTIDPFPNYDAEIVYFPQTNALAIQGHPEYFPTEHEVNQYTRRLVSIYLDRQ